MSITLELVCQHLALEELTNLQRALAILLWFRMDDVNAEIPLSMLVETLQRHALGNPKPARLRDDLRNSKMVLTGKRGYRLRADRVPALSKTLAEVFRIPSMDTLGETSKEPPIAKPHDGSQLSPTINNRKGPEGTPGNSTSVGLPNVFIGTSVEGLNIGSALHSGLEYESEPTRWDQGVFGPNRAPLDSLLVAARKSDFAIIVLTPDDVVTKRNNSSASARDNCIFELGLFMGALGTERCFFVHPRGVALGLPSDLAGLVTLTYPARSDGNIRAALQPAIETVLNAIRKAGRKSMKFRT